MSHFAKVQGGRVVNVIRADQDFIDSLRDDTPGRWIQCSYGTRGGQHRMGKKPLRRDFPGIGWHYDKKQDVFYPPSPGPEYVLKKDTPTWEAPDAGAAEDQVSA